MALGFIPATGDWHYRAFDTNSAATFLKGCLVALNGARNLVEYDSTLSQYVGIAMQNSANSTPTGKVNVAIPRPGCTARTDVWTGIGASSISVGHAMGTGKLGNYNSFVTTLATSVFSKIVTIVGPVRSADSTVEVAFIQNEALVYSTSSVSIN